MSNLIYLTKLNKYKLKLNYKGGDSDLHPLLKIRTDMVLYTITSSIKGGDAENIIYIINEEYNKIFNMKKNYELGIKEIDKIPTSIDFRIIPNNLDNKNNRPVYKFGSSSAIYELKNQSNLKDTKKYILRLFDTSDTGIHLYGLKKIRNEYNLFLKYLLHIYYYGTLNIMKIGQVKPINIDYIITKPYNTDISTFTIEQKYKFLKNNIQMLLELRLQNCFHSDYKLSNLGWNDNLNIVLIDYDKYTIMKIDPSLIIKLNSDKYRLSFPYTYTPEYLKTNNSNYVNSTDYTKYDKFSVGGLATVISKLQLPNDLVTEFKLNDSYDNILTYEQMLAKLI